MYCTRILLLVVKYV